MATFTIQLRAIRHLTREIQIEAGSEADARAKVKQWPLGSLNWDESEPEDIQIESITAR